MSDTVNNYRRLIMYPLGNRSVSLNNLKDAVALEKKGNTQKEDQSMQWRAK